MIQIFILILLGLLTGVLCGLVGIGGGLVIVPALVYLFGFSQHMAQGTTIAMMIPPIGLLAAITYYKQGYVDIKTAIFIALGVFIGAYLGSRIAVVYLI